MNIKNVLVGLFCSLAMVGCAGGVGDGCCGWSGMDITGSGQVKRVSKVSPMICPDYYAVDISLGVMRNGVGSVSKEDMILYLPDNMLIDMKRAAESSAIINFVYNERRSSNCVPDARLLSFKVVQ